MSRTVGILQTGRAAEALAARHGDYPDMMRQMLSGHGLSFRTYAVLDGDLPASPGDCEAWLITGSRHAVYEPWPWIPPLEDFIREIFAAGPPLVGICFGHQIIAQAMGGRVEKSAAGWGVGPMIYDWTDGGSVVINAWHQDQVIALPEQARRLASSDFCPNAILAYGDQALTYQAHPEFGPDFGRDLLGLRRDTLPDDVCARADAAFASLTPSTGVARQIVQFLTARVMVGSANPQDPPQGPEQQT